MRHAALLIVFLLVPLMLFASTADEYLVDLGRQYLDQGQLRSAQQEFERALRINPSNLEARQYLQQLRGASVSSTLDILSRSGAQSRSRRKEAAVIEIPLSRPAPEKSTYTSYRRLEPSKPVIIASKPTQASREIPQTSVPQLAQIQEVTSEPVSITQDEDDEAPLGQIPQDDPDELYNEYVGPGHIPAQPVEELALQEEEVGWEVSGHFQTSFGVEKGELFGKKANADLSEENWRILDAAALNRRENTFDPAVYTRLRFMVDLPKESGWAFHSHWDISPWSFIGKTNKVTIDSAFGDTAEIQMKYWSNNRYTVNENVLTSRLGNSFALPEVKVVNGKTPSFNVRGNFTPRDTFNIPEMEVKRDFWPLRELWTEYNNDRIHFKFFPVGMEDQAYTSDDPLKVTNNRIYWEESQWLINWEAGHLNYGANPEDFFKGYWDDSFAFATRDSVLTRLTALRGFTLGITGDKSMFDISLASPKDLWQDYDVFYTFNNAARWKYYVMEDLLTVGLVHGGKYGLNQRSLDASNQVVGVDFNLALNANTEVFVEGLTSRTRLDKTSAYETKERGNAYHVNLVGSSSEPFGKDYHSVTPYKEEPFYKWKLALTHMDPGFESSLSSYRETRDDSYWSRHLTFKEPFQYYFEGLDRPTLRWDDLRVFRIGDGIDYGRNTISFRWEANNWADNSLDMLFDVRNVHDTEGQYIENVTRLEGTYLVTPKLTTKFLTLHHDIPRTVEGIDPFVIDARSGDAYRNTNVAGGEDRSLKTVTLGVKYDFFHWMYGHFTWEHSNDTTVGYSNFPRGLLQWSSMQNYYEEDRRYRELIYGLNRADVFPLFDYFDIWKVGLGFRPAKKLDVYLNYTRNEYDWAQIIDDNMNHIGLELNYHPVAKLAMNFRYVYSRVNDITELNDNGYVITRDHHNIFTEARFKLDPETELIGQYGVGNIAGIINTVYSPFGGGVATLDTQHIFRLYYHKRF